METIGTKVLLKGDRIEINEHTYEDGVKEYTLSKDSVNRMWLTKDEVTSLKYALRNVR